MATNASATRRSSASSPTGRALPSTTRSSPRSSALSPVVSTQRGLAARFRTFRSPGCPSGRTVESQYTSASRSPRRASAQGVGRPPGAL
ncbi:hypothetical protein [Streptomyces sp. 8K308]|uniref:hypothetical protein n=1 Tax=Streptomyces sp. 8K308 TaxID=2530388 RepID=UPI001A9FFC23